MNCKRMLRYSCAATALIGYVASQTVRAEATHRPHYKVVDLGPVGPTGQPYHISGSGLIAGGVNDVNSPEHAVLWLNQVKVDLARRGLGGPNSLAFWVNDLGHVVGEAQTSVTDPLGEDFCGFAALGNPSTGTTCSPFIWSVEEGMRPLPIGKARNGVANAINNRGEIAGTLENGTPDSTCPALDPTHGQTQQLEFRPVVWRGKNAHELTNPDGDDDPDGVAFAINDKGQAVGATGTCTAFNATSNQTYLQGQHIVLWEHGTATDLGSLGAVASGGGNTALIVNNAGEVVGVSGTSDGSFHAFFWTREHGMQDVGTLPGDAASVALSVNDAGVITGISFAPSFSPRAFVTINGVPTDLNSLTGKSNTLSLLDACSINDRGEIVGFAVDSSGALHGYVAKPEQ
jgi:probable HAF family extracellular repeat protein